MKSFDIFSDCHIKACWSLKCRAILKSLVSFFRRTYALFVGFKMKPLRKSVFLCKDKDQLSFCRKPCWNAERGNHLFLSNWWIPSVLFNFVTIPKLIDCVNIGKRSGTAKLVFQYILVLNWVKQLSLWVLLNQSKCSLEPKDFLRGSAPLNPQLRGSDPPQLR